MQTDGQLEQTYQDYDPQETQEWLESLEAIIKNQGGDRAVYLLESLQKFATRKGLDMPFSANTPYVNSIPYEKQPPFPGDRELERRIKSCVRWNAMSMVVRANSNDSGVGGHISSFASSATLLEVGFNHFFHGRNENHPGDLIYFQGHASPGIYARAFTEGRLTEEQLMNFRRELAPGGGLSSYPHPWLMPNFWQFPTVSMGLGPIMAIYQARFCQYLKDRGLIDSDQARVWAFIGYGETDEPETLGAINLASREGLDNLTFVINCNLQRLDGPVRGNSKIIQELEASFRGAGWNVIKVIWGSDWDALLAKDKDGKLVKRMNEIVDGQYQKYSVADGAYIREHFFGTDPDLLKLAEPFSDKQLERMSRGGHDPVKVYSAYYAATQTKGAPTVILAKTIKGYGLGEAGEGRNITHQQKKLNEEEMREFRSRFGIPISDEAVLTTPFYRPPEDSPEMRYMRHRREMLGGPLPSRKVLVEPIETPPLKEFKEFLEGTGDRAVSTTMAFVRMFARLLRHKELGKLLVPIIPDEARTFGMEALFRQCGIYSHKGQVYEPVDSDSLLYYREAKDGQILEEGITEAGSMSSFIAAGTAYANHGVNTIPFFIYYSMFGFQRIGDLVWAAADMRCKGFMLGATAGRTTLNGEGLQHQDGHSHLLASTIPNLLTYDPAYAYEIAVIIADGLRRMYKEQESIFYYLTLGNENYAMPAMPDGVEEGILKGLYKFRPSRKSGKKKAPVAQLLGSGSILNEVLRAQDILEQDFGVEAHVWSATSYKELRRDALACERWNRLHPGAEPRVSYVEALLEKEDGLFVAASDYMKILPEQIGRWVPGGLIPLGTDGFGRSETREALRRFFEVDAECITLATLAGLWKRGEVSRETVEKAIKKLDIDPEKVDPVVS
jgi:pyruvate dehydrogenase E1 component